MVKPDPTEVAWLLHDLCTQLGYSMAARQPERFIELVSKGPDSFADAVLVAEGLDPALEKRCVVTPGNSWRRGSSAGPRVVAKMGPSNRPFERAGMNPRRRCERARAGRSTPFRSAAGEPND